VYSAIKNPLIAREVSKILGRDISNEPTASFTTSRGETIYLVQTRGPSYLNEISLHKGATLDFVEITFEGGCNGCPYKGKGQTNICKDCIS
jgi:hypothetical protein